MKRLKRCLALFLALMMALGCMTMFASATTGSNTLETTGEMNLTIHATERTHQYVIYQIFTGNPNADGTLTYINWGDSIKTDSYDLCSALISQLQSATLPDGTTSHIYTYFRNLTATSSADYVAAAYTQLPESPEVYKDEFATIVDYVIKQSTTVVEQYSSPDISDSSAGGYDYKFSNLAGGFYLVDETPNVQNTGVSYSSYILAVASANATANDKTVSSPTLTKEIVTEKSADAAGSDYTNAAIGDTVTFRLKSNVPDMTYYSNYYFIITDVLSEGLTYDADTANMVVTVGGNALTNEDVATEGNTTTYKLIKTVSEDGITTLEIVFNNFLQYISQASDRDVCVYYDATLNSNAVIGSGSGTTNNGAATLTYSNDPNYIYTGLAGSDGTKDTNQPGTGEPVGKTPECTVYVYTTAIDLFKKDAAGNPLTGATFTIEGTALNTIAVATSELTENSSAAADATVYYKLKDGSYTTTAPTEDTESDYDSTTTTYVMQSSSTDKAASEHVITDLTVGEDGYLHLNGLKAGVYTIKETQAPDGYEELRSPIEITITYTDPSSTAVAGGCTWAAALSTDAEKNDEGLATVSVDSNGRISLSVENAARKVLPTTGGMGTTIFYVAGSVLVLGAAVLLITKRRMKNSDD
jgi:fimbrial isopeptide formation D2 family protein/LPXTG-motif cell wall-anchored protein